jgi:HrpA-like RNA helicase
MASEGMEATVKEVTGVCVVLQAAVKELASLGALCVRSEELTSLGRVLLKLPVDARLGKLLLLGVCFRATDECLTIAAALATSRSPFLSPIDRREEVAAQRPHASCYASSHASYHTPYILPRLVLAHASPPHCRTPLHSHTHAHGHAHARG